MRPGKSILPEEMRQNAFVFVQRTGQNAFAFAVKDGTNCFCLCRKRRDKMRSPLSKEQDKMFLFLPEGRDRMFIMLSQPSAVRESVPRLCLHNTDAPVSIHAGLRQKKNLSSGNRHKLQATGVKKNRVFPPVTVAPKAGFPPP